MIYLWIASIVLSILATLAFLNWRIRVHTKRVRSELLRYQGWSQARDIARLANVPLGLIYGILYSLVEENFAIAERRTNGRTLFKLNKERET